MFRVIKASKEIIPFEDLHIRTFRLNTDFAPTPMEKCSEEKGREIRDIFKRYEPQLRSSIKRFQIDDLITD